MSKQYEYKIIYLDTCIGKDALELTINDWANKGYKVINFYIQTVTRGSMIRSTVNELIVMFEKEMELDV